MGMLAILPNTIVKTTDVIRGEMKNQAGPKIVCLYVATKSRHTKRMTKSRYRQSSGKLICNQLRSGVMILVHWLLSVSPFSDDEIALASRSAVLRESNVTPKSCASSASLAPSVHVDHEPGLRGADVSTVEMDGQAFPLLGQRPFAAVRTVGLVATFDRHFRLRA